MFEVAINESIIFFFNKSNKRMVPDSQYGRCKKRNSIGPWLSNSLSSSTCMQHAGGVHPYQPLDSCISCSRMTLVGGRLPSDSWPSRG